MDVMMGYEAEMREIFAALNLESQMDLFVRAKWFHMNQEEARKRGNQDDNLVLERQSPCESDS